jgi:hypothetical protein
VRGDRAGKAKWTREALERTGFVGWHPFSDLPGRLRSIGRDAGGVYVVYRESLQMPEWLDWSPAGTWRGDPTVPREVLVANWVKGANVINIGKAKHGQLRTRLGAYCSFGAGGKGRHYGGRLIWQLKDSADLLVAWLVITDLVINPREVERDMIDTFRVAYGKRPFANLSD